MCIYIYIHVFISLNVYMHIYLYIYIQAGRKKSRKKSIIHRNSTKNGKNYPKNSNENKKYYNKTLSGDSVELNNINDDHSYRSGSNNIDTNRSTSNNTEIALKKSLKSESTELTSSDLLSGIESSDPLARPGSSGPFPGPGSSGPSSSDPLSKPGSSGSQNPTIDTIKSNKNGKQNSKIKRNESEYYDKKEFVNKTYIDWLFSGKKNPKISDPFDETGMHYFVCSGEYLCIYIYIYIYIYRYTSKYIYIYGY
jgi:hypothetical protein